MDVDLPSGPKSQSLSARCRMGDAGEAAVGISAQIAPGAAQPQQLADAANLAATLVAGVRLAARPLWIV